MSSIVHSYMEVLTYRPTAFDLYYISDFIPLQCHLTDELLLEAPSISTNTVDSAVSEKHVGMLVCT